MDWRRGALRRGVTNGPPCREGERLEEGLLLEAVTADGAVLRQGSQRFQLPVR
ncbi:MAG: general secretion pathway protein GspB [Candidatus Competibacteraceae bacterium]|nr:general secretion pathway protein GspB [Candidatus Competibacteraceae bacterium]MCP5124759.1 general secretion pathway protein GspB [Gammaproteobacteria bacterium]